MVKTKKTISLANNSISEQRKPEDKLDVIRELQNLPGIEDYNWFLDRAFGSAKKKAEKELRLQKQKQKTRLGRLKKGKGRRELKGKGRRKIRQEKIILKRKFLKQRIGMEKLRIETIENVLVQHLEKLLERFPDFSGLNKFYQEVIDITIGVGGLKKSLAALNWGIKKIKEFSSLTKKKLSKTREIEWAKKQRQAYYGRISSVMKQLNQSLVFLESARKVFKTYPLIKEMETAVVFGFPNVGKTTLLYELTGSKPEIAPYAFTTKGVNVAYMNSLQLLDTPGTLNRMEKMNNIEKQAFLALKYFGHKVVYIFDLTETFSLEEQEKLYQRVKKINPRAKRLIYLSKTSLIEKELIEEFKKEHKKDTVFETVKKLKKSLFNA